MTETDTRELGKVTKDKRGIGVLSTICALAVKRATAQVSKLLCGLSLQGEKTFDGSLPTDITYFQSFRSKNHQTLRLN